MNTKESKREKAVRLMQAGATYMEVAAQTGEKLAMLRTWKKRHVVGVPTIKATKTAKPKITKSTVSAKTEKQASEANQTSQIKDEHEAFKVAYQKQITELNNDIETLRNAKDETTQSDNVPNMTYYNMPLIIGILALHVSAVYGVGEILKTVFHTYIMGYLTALVFVSAGLIMFASKRFSIGISWVVLIATFVIESYCNYLTIYMNMSDEKLAQFENYTNTGILFFCISVSIPLVNLALEYLLFNAENVK